MDAKTEHNTLDVGIKQSNKNLLFFFQESHYEAIVCRLLA